MIQKVVRLVKENWVFIVIAVVVVVLMNMFNTDNEYEGCSTCSLGSAGVLLDTELSGCSTCSAGDAGVLQDTETTPATEMYMPDQYYESPMEIADTIAEVAHNPGEVEAAVQDREDDDTMIIDPTDYAAQSDEQLVNDFYGDDEIDYDKREEIRTIRFTPIDFLESDGSFTLL